MNQSDDKMFAARHSLSHLLAMAVLELLPDAKLAIGPPIENGFYYDFKLSRALTPNDLVQLEKRVRSLIAENLEFKRHEKDISQALAWAQEADQPFKTELIRDLASEGEKSVSFYTTGERFTDLCHGPHVERSGEIAADGFQLTRVSGSYWRGDEQRDQLQRVYGVAFANKKELAAHLLLLKEAAARDHRKLGKQLDLFTFSPLVGAGLPLFTPRGQILREELVKLVTEIQGRHVAFERVNIPHIAKSELYKTSGHFEKFADDLFYVSGKSGTEMVMKPMNCPHHIEIFQSRPRSYRELPIRYAEVTTCYRDEQPGELVGLSRVRSLTQDDGHVFCRPDQIEGEVAALMAAVDELYTVLNIPLTARLSKRGDEREKYLGGDELWEQSEGILQRVLQQHWTRPWEEATGEAAFYGPKIDFIGQDAIGRQWQLATIQLDFNLPARFDLAYIDESGQKKQPVMLHRALLGSLERFLSVLIEHYGGRFPFWLAPEQVRVLSVAADHSAAATKLVSELVADGLRAGADTSNETVGKKIFAANEMKVPVVIVIGDREVKDGVKEVRLRSDLAANQQRPVGDTTELSLWLQQAVQKRSATLD